MNTVFLTGATGFIGAYLLHELLEQTSAKMVCLVRAASEIEGFERVKDNLKNHNLWSERYAANISICIGDLSESLFGLTPEEFENLAKKVDTIFHSGANVNFIYSYKHLKSANVDSMGTILKLAVADKTKISQIHFISTLGVVMSSGYPSGATILGDEELIHDKDIPNGYEQSKYVSDKILQQAIKKYHIPGNIYRLGLVSGESTSGTYHKLNEFLPSFLKGCIQLGSWPEVDSTLEMVPVDFLCKAIIHIALNPENLGKAYFALHPKPNKISEIITFYQNKGYPIETLPWEQWKEKLLKQSTKNLHDNALLPFITFIKALPSVHTFFPKVDKTHFLMAIEGLDYKCADQIELLEKYNQHFIKVGYYTVPEEQPHE